MEPVNPIAEAYTEKLTSPHDVLLQKILKDTYSNHGHSHMISGTVQGKFLQVISQMINPLKVLEIGTFTGFSALCLAAGLQEEGMLHTIELREEDAMTAQKYFDESRYKDKLKLHIGNANNIIPSLNETWDLVFIDADKTGYIDYYELTLPAIKQGGYILADNVLFHGAVLEENISGKNAKAIHAFNEHVSADHRTEQVMITLRDGISIIRKL